MSSYTSDRRDSDLTTTYIKREHYTATPLPQHHQPSNLPTAYIKTESPPPPLSGIPPSSPPHPPTIAPSTPYIKQEQPLPHHHYPCWFPHCQHIESSQDGITLHYTRAHTNLPAITCTIPHCALSTTTFTRPDDFDKHLDTYHPGWSLQCKHCCADGCKSAVYGSYSRLQEHLDKVHFGNKEWTCTHCGVVYAKFKDFRQCLSWHRKREKKERLRGMGVGR